MKIVVIHNIMDPVGFRTFVENWEQNGAILPEGFTLTIQTANPEWTQGFCIWEAPSIIDLENFLEPLIGDYSYNLYYEVNVKGLPA